MREEEANSARGPELDDQIVIKRRTGELGVVPNFCLDFVVRVGAFGSESTLYMVYFIYGNGNIGGWNPLWKIIGGILSGL
jgi:hypothetical protein